MFDFLRKKVSGFINKIVKKEEEKPVEKPKEIPKEIPLKPKIEEKKVEEPKPAPVEKPKPVAKPVEKPRIEPEKPKVIPPKVEPEVKKEEPKPIITKEIPKKAEPAKPKEKPREVKVGILSAIKGLVTGEIEIKKSDVEPLLEEFELELLESDVALEVAETIKQNLEQQLIGAKIKRNRLNPFVKEILETTLRSLLENKKQFDLVEKIKDFEKPVKIMFLGPNGAGKTTSMGKVAHLLLQRGYKVVFAASDTFRAAAIEQLSIHAERLKVPIIKRPYGSDSTAVAYDAVNYAKAHKIDAVLIDTAGRQETNINLLNELKKMQRVIQPHLKIYIGESIAGNALLEQVGTFHKELGVDGVILTKLDCDPKGGTMLSISKATGRPILYVGVGQGYEDLEAFDPEKIVQRILENN